jgi:hypothetical protein
MYRGAWMLLTQPMLWQSVKMAAIASNSVGSAATPSSATLAEGKVWWVIASKGVTPAIYNAKS